MPPSEILLVALPPVPPLSVSGEDAPWVCHLTLLSLLLPVPGQMNSTGIFCPLMVLASMMHLGWELLASVPCLLQPAAGWQPSFLE